jgi:hypothetical protein
MSLRLMPRSIPILIAMPIPREDMSIISGACICKRCIPEGMTIGGMLFPVLDTICSTIMNSRRNLVSEMFK